MATPFVSEIRIFGFNFAPTGWATCNGQLMAISQNTALFSLLGTYYGGDGKSTFALPDLQGSFPLHMGQGPGGSPFFQGQMSGTPTVTLIQTEIPLHTHSVLPVTATAADSATPQNATFAPSPSRPWSTGAAGTTLSPFAVGMAGGSLPHNNMPPFLALNFCIALQGVFPARN